jgi:hypothetical protein
VGGLLVSCASKAEPWSTEPLVGFASEYASNPYLQSEDARSRSDEALLFNAPTHYDGDSTHFSVTPSMRYSDSRGGYASLASNYYHLNSAASFLGDLDSLQLTAAAGRDSSLYQYGLSSNGLGVRTDAYSAGVDWQRQITERFGFELDGNWSRVAYNQEAALSGLVNYRYISAGPALNYLLSERDKLQVQATAGQYRALDGNTESRNYSLQLGFNRSVSELWTLATSAGYSRSNNSERLYFGPFFIGPVEFGPYYVGTLHTVQEGPIYSVSLARQDEKLTFKGSLSRAFLPSGFVYLSREDVAEVSLSDTVTERWTLAAKMDYQDTATPTSSGLLSKEHYISGQCSAAWKWTPEWALSLSATWVNVKYDLLGLTAQSSGVNFEISRQFLRIDL